MQNNFKEVQPLIQYNKFIFLLVSLILIVYSRSISADFVVLDDLSAIVNNPLIHDFKSALSSLLLQPILYSSIYQIFKTNPIPFHLLNLVLHLITVLISYQLISLLFNKKIAQISTLIFSIHPINTEAVTWISGGAHIYNTIFVILPIYFYSIFRQGEDKRWLIYSLLTYSIGLLLLKSPWLVILPPSIVIIDQFIINSKFNWKTIKYTLLFLVPLFIFYLLHLQNRAEVRIDQRKPDASFSVLNQQKLIPFWESAPFTITKMIEQYIFPKTLTMYYDGDPISKFEYVLMVIGFILYLFVILFYYKRDKRISGLLILLPTLIWPTLSPIKITWFIAERYLYIGSIFYSVLITICLIKVGSLINSQKIFYLIVTVVILMYSIRTIIRNEEWQNSITLATATIESSPKSFRPYNDLGGAHALKGEYDLAINAYKKALELGPSGVAVKNIGYIYLTIGMPYINDQMYKEGSIKSSSNEANFAHETAQQLVQEQKFQESIYFYNLALEKGFQNPLQILTGVSQIYIYYQQYDKVIDVLNAIISINEESDFAWYWLGYVSYKKDDIESAEKYLNQTLKINPDNIDAKNNLLMIQTQKLK